MPRRTNEFQRLITRIYDQMKSPGDSVSESAMVPERGTSTKREVDILIETKSFGMTLRIAIECRGRKDKEDIEWIDGLIGKYRDLQVDKIVAVSKSGFSKSATEKAAANRIVTLTLQQAVDTDWPSEFVRLGMARVVRHDRPHAATLTTEMLPPSPPEFDLNTAVLTENGERIGTVLELCQLFYLENKDKITGEINANFSQMFNKLIDFNTSMIISVLTKSFEDNIYLLSDGLRVRLSTLTLEMESSFTYDLAAVTHHVIGEVLATSTTLQGDQADQSFSITVVQKSKKPNEAKVHIDPVASIKRRKSQ